MYVTELVDPDKTAVTLDNGLRVLVIRLPHLHTAAAQLMVRAGSRYEDDATAGLSHFVEHMIYRGSAGYPTTFELNRAIERMGGGLYAETSREITSYLLEAPPESLPGLLEVLADALIRPGWHELDVERRIVLEEILEDLDDDGTLIRADDVARKLAWNGHPLGLPITGTQESVADFTTESVAAHHGSYYTAANAVLAIAGPFEPEALVEAARRAFSGLATGRRAQPRPAPARLDGPALQYVRYPESQTTLNLTVHTLCEPDPLAPAQSLLFRILDDGLSTRLYRRIVDELGLAYSVGISPEVLEDVVLMDFSASCAHDTAGRLLGEVMQIVGGLREAPPDADELEIARNRLLWDVQASMDNPRSMVEYYGATELLARPRTLSERARQVLAATPEQVHEVARTVFRPERWALAAVGKLDATQQSALQELIETC